MTNPRRGQRDTAMSADKPRTSDSWPRRAADTGLRLLGRYVFSVFFRETEVVGSANFPRTGPVMVAANHFNSIADGALISTYLPRMPRMLTASIVWDFWIIAPLLNASGVIPVYRRTEAERAAARNRDSFEKVYDLMQEGGVLGLFPEGVSHNDPAVRPPKSGTARLFLEAERLRGPLGITLLPVGLFFEAKSKFRSRMLIRIGAPIEASDLVATYATGNTATRAACVRELSQRVHTALTGVAPSFDNWEDARLLGRAADMWAQPEMALPAKVPLAEAFERRMAFLTGYDWLRVHAPDEVAAFRAVMQDYDQALSAEGLRDEDVASTYPTGALWRATLRTTAGLAWRAVPAMIATVLSYIPYRISGRLGRGNDMDKRASWKIFGSVVLFPLYWVLQAGLAGWAWSAWTGGNGWPIAIAVLLAGPVLGHIALGFHDLLWRSLHRLHAWRRLRGGNARAVRLRSLRQKVLDHLTELIALYEGRPQGPAAN